MYICWFSAAVLVLFFAGFMLYKCWFSAAVFIGRDKKTTEQKREALPVR